MKHGLGLQVYVVPGKAFCALGYGDKESVHTQLGQNDLLMRRTAAEQGRAWRPRQGLWLSRSQQLAELMLEGLTPFADIGSLLLRHLENGFIMDYVKSQCPRLDQLASWMEHKQLGEVFSQLLK